MITVKTNVREVIIKLNGRISSFLPGAENYVGLLRTVAVTQLAVMKSRIHEKGLASDGGSIGTYSTKPLYANPDTLPGKAFAPVGKTGREAFKNGKPLRSRYFAGGYNELKTVIGRNELAGKVNLALSGQMQNQLAIEPTSNGVGIGWPNADFLKRSDILERKYGKKIWAPTSGELDIIVETAQNYANRAISQ